MAPVTRSWCQDFDGGRAFYTAAGHTAASYANDFRKHLAGAIKWAAGRSDPVYSDCGATVSRTTSRSRSPARRISTSRSASTSSRTAA
jgi:type 1 glutamine amidotransferase